MSQPITVDLLSDDDEPPNEAVPPKSNWQVTSTSSSNPNAVDCKPTHNAVATPLSPQPKRQSIEPFSNPTIFFIDDDPTPNKAIFPVFTPSPIVAETPMLEFSNADEAIVKRDGEGFSGAMFPTCTPSIVADNPVLDFPNPNVSIVNCKSKGLSDPIEFSVPISTPSVVAETPFLSPDVAIVECNSKGFSDPQKFSGICGLICLASDDESENDYGIENWKQSDNLTSSLVGSESFLEIRKAHENLTQMPVQSGSLQISSEDGSTQENNTSAEEIDRPEPRENILKRNRRSKVNVNKENDVDEGNKKRKKTKEGPWQKEEKDQPREREKFQKAAMNAEAARVQLEEEKNQLRDREMLQKELMKAEATRVRSEEENNQLREREKLQKEAIKAEAARLWLEEEINQLREREKLQKEKEAMKAKAEAELNTLRLKEGKKQLREREKLQRATAKAEAARLRLKEEKGQLIEREKLHKEAIRAEAELKRVRLKEEKNQLKEREKLQKAAMKAEAAELKKLEKEKQQWEKGKFALNSIVANVDAKVVELGSVGGHLLTRFAEKGLTYRITSNPIERSVVWDMAVPDQISKLSSNSNVIPYVLVVIEAEEFCNLVLNGTLVEHVSCVRSHYPSHTICYVTNRLMAYINKREQEQYKKPDKCSCWRRPPIEEVLAQLATHFIRVHSRQCLDEAELAEHVVGLTRSLASCRFRKELTRLSVNANGSLIPKDCIDKDLFRKNSWLKALIAIPKVQPRFALAIRKKYPTMRSLLNVYMDPTKSVHEKEFLLKDLTIEGLLGDDRRLGEVCSKRVYRILTAQSGSSNTDDVEDGADLFSQTSTSPL